MVSLPHDDGCAGVYAIVNTITKDVYIGSSINMHQRYIQHRTRLKNHTHSNLLLQAAYDQYGESAFRCVVIEYIDGTDATIRASEAWYIDALQPVYNDRRGWLDGIADFTPQCNLVDVQAMIQHGPYNPPQWTRKYPLAPKAPYRAVNILLSADLVRQMDALARTAQQTRTAWIEAAIREKLARDGA